MAAVRSRAPLPLAEALHEDAPTRAWLSPWTSSSADPALPLASEAGGVRTSGPASAGPVSVTSVFRRTQPAAFPARRVMPQSGATGRFGPCDRFRLSATWALGDRIGDFSITAIADARRSQRHDRNRRPRGLGATRDDRSVGAPLAAKAGESGRDGSSTVVRDGDFLCWASRSAPPRADRCWKSSSSGTRSGTARAPARRRGGALFASPVGLPCSDPCSSRISVNRFAEA